MKSGDACECGGRMMTYCTKRWKTKPLAWRYLRCTSCGNHNKSLVDAPPERASRYLSGNQLGENDPLQSCNKNKKKDNEGNIQLTKGAKQMGHLNLEAVCERYGCEPLDWLRWAKQGIAPKPNGDGLWSNDVLTAWEADGKELITAAKTDRAMNDVLNAGSKWTTSPILYKN